MDKLWIVVILGLLFILGFARPLPPNDLWWHARVGQEILDTGRIPRVDVYSLTEQGEPFYYQSWLAEVIMGALINLGGVRLLIAVRTLIMLVLFGAVLFMSWRASGGDRRVAVPVVLATVVLGLGNQTVRPQLFAYPLFIGVYAILWRYRQGRAGRWVWLIPFLFVIWVNLHGSFALGLGLVGLVLVGELLEYGLPSLARRSTSTPVDQRQRLKTLALVLLVCIFVLIFNPRGVGIVGYVADLLTDAPSQLLGDEWQPLDPMRGLGQTFYALYLAVMAIFALARPPIRLTHLLLTLAFGWLAASGVRYVVWFGLVSAPIVANALVRFPREDLIRWRQRLVRHPIMQRLLDGDGSGYPGFRNLALAALTLAVVVALGLLILYPDEGLWLSPYTGQSAVAYMETTGVRGRLFNELGRGSYVIWALGPEQPVFIDPRFELYPLEHFEQYITLSKAEEGTEALLDEYAFDLLLLGQETQAPLINWVEGRPERWRQVYSDEYTILYQRVAQ
jgi:hypothetical protein